MVEIVDTWKKSKKGNLWREYFVKGQKYTVTVMRSPYGDKWGWQCYGPGGKRLANYFIFSNAEDACKHCDERFAMGGG